MSLHMLPTVTPKMVLLVRRRRKPRNQAQEELSTLAKGVKKYFPAGGNRWDRITNYINVVCRLDNPRTKEECIESVQSKQWEKATCGKFYRCCCSSKRRCCPGAQRRRHLDRRARQATSRGFWSRILQVWTRTSDGRTLPT